MTRVRVNKQSYVVLEHIETFMISWKNPQEVLITLVSGKEISVKWNTRDEAKKYLEHLKSLFDETPGENGQFK